ncbi:NUDIX hydrolase [Candidatus Woesearchaeota archaeon]|nr:NUDIX hydrolase [Candidatus Woesearchaeota archaeon]
MEDKVNEYLTAGQLNEQGISMLLQLLQRLPEDCWIIVVRDALLKMLTRGGTLTPIGLELAELLLPSIKEAQWKQAAAGLLENDGKLNERGKEMAVFLLQRLPQMLGQELHAALLNTFGVRIAVELVIIRNSQVLLTHRKDKFFGEGWHTPGTFVGENETWDKAAQRCADKELNVPLNIIRMLGDARNLPLLHPDDPRSPGHSCSILLLCSIPDDASPQEGTWFSRCPEDMLPVHRKFVPVIDEALTAWPRVMR